MWQHFLQGGAGATGGHYCPILQMRNQVGREVAQNHLRSRLGSGYGEEDCRQTPGSFPRIHLPSHVWPLLQPILPHGLRVRPRWGRGHGQCWDRWGNLRPGPKDTLLLG